MNTQHPAKHMRINGLIEAGRRGARLILGPIYRPAKRVARFFMWIFPVLSKLALPTPENERRLLAVYDTSCQPFSVGDMLLMQEASLLLCEKQHVNIVDFALVYDPKRPAMSHPAFASIVEDNATYHLASILPIAQVNQHLGSVFVFNSHWHLQRFIADNADLYHVWPSGWKFATQEYLYHSIFNDLLYSHYKEHGSIPHLSCRPFLRHWAEAFYQEHVHPHVPITVNMRNNKAFDTHRNLRLECWVEFFQYCDTRYPAKFVVICAQTEIDDRVRRCPNVIIAKDHQTGIEQDLSLIHTAAIHMGADSGPVVMAIFNNKPYLIVSTAVGPHYFSRPEMLQADEEPFLHFWFAGPSQRYAAGVETTELLIKEFARMWAAVDTERWESPAGVAGNVPRTAERMR